MIRMQTTGTRFTLAVAALTGAFVSSPAATTVRVTPWEVSAAAATSIQSTLALDEDFQTETWPEAVSRLLSLMELGPNHDGEGGSAPNRDSFVSAIAFVRQLTWLAPEPRVGMGSDGMAVVEFHEEADLAQLIFYPERQLEYYYHRAGERPLSDEGVMSDPVFLKSFHTAFGFPLVA